MFWVTWQNPREHIPSRSVAQFFPSRLFSVVDLWLSLLVQHDKDKGYSQGSSNGKKKPLHFLLTGKPALSMRFLACLRNMKECNHVRSPILCQL